jgi:hypothetical protein
MNGLGSQLNTPDERMLKSQFNDVKFAGRALLRASDESVGGRAACGILQQQIALYTTHERLLLCAHRIRPDKATTRPSPWCTTS